MRIGYPFEFEVETWTPSRAGLKRKSEETTVAWHDRPWKTGNVWKTEGALETFVAGSPAKRERGQLPDCPWGGRDALGRFPALVKLPLDQLARVYCGATGYGFADRVYVSTTGDVYVLEFKRVTINAAAVGQLVGYVTRLAEAPTLRDLLLATPRPGPRGRLRSRDGREAEAERDRDRLERERLRAKDAGSSPRTRPPGLGIRR